MNRNKWYDDGCPVLGRLYYTVHCYRIIHTVQYSQYHTVINFVVMILHTVVDCTVLHCTIFRVNTVQYIALTLISLYSILLLESFVQSTTVWYCNPSCESNGDNSSRISKFSQPVKSVRWQHCISNTVSYHGTKRLWSLFLFQNIIKMGGCCCTGHILLYDTYPRIFQQFFVMQW